VPGGAVPAGDADREPAGAGAEGGLALCQRAQGASFREFRHGVRRVRNWQLYRNNQEPGSGVPVVDVVLPATPHGVRRLAADRHLERRDQLIVHLDGAAGMHGRLCHEPFPVRSREGRHDEAGEEVAGRPN
jgi:hypothetical protein